MALPPEDTTVDELSEEEEEAPEYSPRLLQLDGHRTQIDGWLTDESATEDDRAKWQSLRTDVVAAIEREQVRTGTALPEVRPDNPKVDPSSLAQEELEDIRPGDVLPAREGEIASFPGYSILTKTPTTWSEAYDQAAEIHASKNQRAAQAEATKSRVRMTGRTLSPSMPATIMEAAEDLPDAEQGLSRSLNRIHQAEFGEDMPTDNTQIRNTYKAWVISTLAGSEDAKPDQLIVTRRAGRMPQWAVDEYLAAFKKQEAAEVAGVGGASVAIKLRSEEQIYQHMTQGIPDVRSRPAKEVTSEPFYTRLTPETQLAYQRVKKEIKEGKKGEVTELDLGVYLYINNWAKTRFGRGYASPEEMIEFFPEDHALFDDRTRELAKTLGFSIEAHLDITAQAEEFNALSEYHRSLIPLVEARAAALRNWGDRLEAKQDELDKMQEEGRRAVGGREWDIARADQDEGLASYTYSMRQFMEYVRTTLLPLETDLMTRETLFNRTLEEASASQQELEDQAPRRMIGFVGVGESGRLAAPVPFFSDENKRLELSRITPSDSITSTMLMFTASEKYLTQLRTAFDDLMDTPPEEVEFFYGTVGPQVQNAFEHWEGKLRPGDVVNPTGWDGSVQRYAAHMTKHRQILTGSFMEKEFNRLMEEEPNAPRADVAQRALEYARKRADAIVDRATVNQRAPWIMPDPTRQYERYLNDEIWQATLAKGIGYTLEGVSLAASAMPWSRSTEGIPDLWEGAREGQDSLEMGIGRQVGAMLLPQKAIAGKLYWDGNEKARMTEGNLVEGWGPAWRPVDTVIRWLGFGTEPFAATAAQAKANIEREMMAEGKTVTEIEIARKQGHGKELLRRMVQDVGEPDTIARLVETTDNVGPWLMSFPEDMFGNRDTAWQKFGNNTFRAGMFAGLITEPTAIDAAVLMGKGTLYTAARFNQPFRKLTGLRDVDELLRGEPVFVDVLAKYIPDPINNLDALRTLPHDELMELTESLVALASKQADINPGANVLIRTILNQAALGVHRRFNQQAKDILTQANARATNIQDRAFKSAQDWEKLADDVADPAFDPTAPIKGKPGVTMDDLEKVFLGELDDITLQLENLRGAIGTQTELWSLQGAALEALVALEKLHDARKVRDPSAGMPVVDDVFKAIFDIANPGARPGGAKTRVKAVRALEKALDFTRPEMQGLLGATKLSESQVLTYIDQVLLARGVKLDEFLLEARALYGSGPTGRGIPKAARPKNLRKRRAALREHAKDVVRHGYAFGAKENIVRLKAKRAVTERNLAMNLDANTRLVTAARKWLQAIGELPKGRTASVLQIDDALNALRKSVRSGEEMGTTLRSQANRAAMVARSAQGMRDVAASNVAGAIIDTMNWLRTMKSDPSMLRRIVETAQRGWVMGEKGKRLETPDGQFVPFGKDRAIWRQLAQAEDGQLQRIIAATFREGARLEDQAEFLREFFLRGNYIATLFRDPQGLLFRGAKGGFTTYSQAFGLMGSYGKILGRGKAALGFMFGWIPSGAAHWASLAGAERANKLGWVGTQRAYVYYGRAQFRKNGALYGFRSYFERQLGISSVSLSERLEGVMVREHSVAQNANSDIVKFISYQTKWLEKRLRWEKAAAGAADPSEIVEAFQRAWYEYLFTTTAKVLLEDPYSPTLMPRFGGKKWAALAEGKRLKHGLVELTAFTRDYPIVIDAVEHLLNSARLTDPVGDVAARGHKNFNRKSLPNAPAYNGILHAFLPELAETKRAFSLDQYKLAVNRYEDAVFADLAAKYIDSTTGFSTVRASDPSKVYNDLYDIIIQRTDEFFGTKYGSKGAAMTHRVQHLAIYHNAMLLTASHGRAIKALSIELPNFHPSMFHSANALLSNFKDLEPPVTRAIEVGMNVIPIRKLEILNREMDVGNVRGYTKRGRVKEQVAEPYMKDPHAEAADVDLRRIYEAEDVYWRLDGTPASIVEKVIIKDVVDAAGKKRPVKYLLLENGRTVLEADYVPQANHAKLAFLDALEVMTFWGMRNMDGLLEDDAVSMFLTMRKRLDKQYQRFLIESNSNGGMQMIPANAFSHLEDTVGEFRKLLYAGQWADAPQRMPQFVQTTAMGLRRWKDMLLTGFVGVARNAMMFVQGFGDTTNQLTTGVPLKEIARNTTHGFFGYLGPRAAKQFDSVMIEVRNAAAAKGRVGLTPMSAAVTDPVLSKLLTRDPEVIFELPGGVGKVSAYKLAQWQDEDVGMAGIVTRGLDEALDRTAKSMFNRYEKPGRESVRQAVISWAIANKYAETVAEATENLLFMHKRFIRAATEEGTRRTRQSFWLNEMMKHGNRELARERLNYSLMNWMSGTTHFDLQIIGQFTVFTTFFREMLRQGFLSWFDMPSTSIGQYIDRHLKFQTGAQRNQMFIRYKQMQDEANLSPEGDMTYEDAQDYTKRKFYPDYNFDRLLFDVRKFDTLEKEFYAQKNIPYTHSYRGLPGVQSLMFLDAVVNMAVLTGALASGIGEKLHILPEDRGRSDVAIVAFMELMDTFVWDHWLLVVEMLAIKTQAERGKHPSIYGTKLTLGDAEALRFLGHIQPLIPFDEVVTTTDKGDIRLSVGADPSISNVLAVTLALAAKETSMLKSYDRTLGAAAVFDPDAPWAPVGMQADAKFRGEWAAIMDQMREQTGVFPERYLNLDKTEKYSGYNLNKLLQENNAKLSSEDKLLLRRAFEEAVRRNAKEEYDE